jgi:hypothetical protein
MVHAAGNIFDSRIAYLARHAGARFPGDVEEQMLHLYTDEAPDLVTALQFYCVLNNAVQNRSANLRPPLDILCVADKAIHSRCQPMKQTAYRGLSIDKLPFIVGHPYCFARGEDIK